jgi:uncharacterized protein (DUF4415 family)
MAQKKRVTKSRKNAGRGAKAAHKSGRRSGLSLSASVEPSKRSRSAMDEVLEFYKPIKKPVTLRLDADVLAWFKGGGRRYQTRINGALRKVMEREMKEEGV